MRTSLIGLNDLVALLGRRDGTRIMHKMRQNGIAPLYHATTNEKDYIRDRAYFDVAETIEAYRQNIKAAKGTHRERYIEHWKRTILELEMILGQGVGVGIT